MRTPALMATALVAVALVIPGCAGQPRHGSASDRGTIGRDADGSATASAPDSRRERNGSAARAAMGTEAEVAQDAPLRALIPQPPVPADAPVSAVVAVQPDVVPAQAGTPGRGADAPPSTFERGGASWYGLGFHNRRTASGERFDMGAFTAAHRTLPFGTRICVHSLVNGRTVLVRVNDRGPAAPQRIVDLSRAAAEALGMIGVGIKQVALSRPAAGSDDCEGP